MFDVISALELAASAAVVVGAFSLLFGRTTAERLTVAGLMAAWFAVVVAAGATGLLHYERGLGVPGLAAAVVGPILLFSALGFGTRTGRALIDAAPLELLIGVQAVRVLGVSFVLLHAAGRLPAPFAPVAGWGDIAVGLIAVWVAWLAARAPERAFRPALAWNVFGVLDLVAAVALGATSSPGPIRVFFAEPGSALMTSLPWIIIPCFLVPALTFLHLATFRRLRAYAPAEGGPARAAS